jgi:restriction system protein
MNRLAREAERAQRANLRAKEHVIKAQQRAVRETARYEKLQGKAAKANYTDSRLAETEEANLELNRKVDELNDILVSALNRDPKIDFSKFMQRVTDEDLDNDPSLRVPDRPFERDFSPPSPTFMQRFVPPLKKRYLDVVTTHRKIFAERLAEYDAALGQRKVALEAFQAAADEHNRQIKEAEASFFANEPESIRNYFELVLTESIYPTEFPKNFRVAYSLESKNIIFDYQLPSLNEAIPTTEKFRYIKVSDEIIEARRNERQRQAFYANVISQVSLKSIFEIFAADALNQVDVVTMNGYVSAVDPATGKLINPYIISIRTTRDDFAGLDLANVEPTACLKKLSATLSRSPAELVAIKPVVDINMVDSRFIKEQDVLSGLDNRSNLMELTPGEFESLITNLFQRMGLETKLTQASRDGGVDCVAFDSRPILGGKVIIQAKRYKNTVGVSAVRDLFGTMHNEGASKGILVTTSTGNHGSAKHGFGRF